MKNNFNVALLVCAVSLSAISAFYAVSGLVAIFAAAPIAIIIMGSILELSKITLAAWLHREWSNTSKLLRSYFIVAIGVLMLLTSIGVFGFLSKAHLEQSVSVGDVSAKLSILDERIKVEQENEQNAKNQLRMLDTQVEQTIGRSESPKAVERSLQIRRGQQKERALLLDEVRSAQSNIARLNEERFPLATEFRKFENEVGPIKYVASMVYGGHVSGNDLEHSVRIMILLIVMVFDPLAVLMILAATRKKQEFSEQLTTHSLDDPRVEIDPVFGEPEFHVNEVLTKPTSGRPDRFKDN